MEETRHVFLEALVKPPHRGVGAWKQPLSLPWGASPLIALITMVVPLYADGRDLCSDERVTGVAERVARIEGALSGRYPDAGDPCRGDKVAEEVVR